MCAIPHLHLVVITSGHDLVRVGWVDSQTPYLTIRMRLHHGLFGSSSDFNNISINASDDDVVALLVHGTWSGSEVVCRSLVESFVEDI